MTAAVHIGVPAWAAPKASRKRDPDTTHGVPCPHCAGDSIVTDSRPRRNAIKRRRACTTCKRRFTTFEIATDLEPSEGVKMLLKQASELRRLAAVIEQMAARPAEDDSLS